MIFGGSEKIKELNTIANRQSLDVCNPLSTFVLLLDAYIDHPVRKVSGTCKIVSVLHSRDLSNDPIHSIHSPANHSM